MSAPIFSGVACVLARDGGALNPCGTAFLISSRLALTAFHVVADAGDEFSLRFVTSLGPQNIRARVLVELCDEVHDWAILRCEESPPAEATPIALAPPAASARWESRGYPAGRHEDGMAIAGEVRDLFATDRGIRALQLYSSQLSGEIAVGLSGAPCLVQGRAIGFLRSVFSRQGNKTSAGTLYATSSADVSNGLLERLAGGRESAELDELRSRLLAARPSRAAMRFLRTGLAASLACIALVAASVTRVHLEVLDRRSLPAERVQIELHECLRGTVPGNSDEQGELRFTAFRWCPSYEIILKNYGGSHERVFQLASSDFLLSSEIGCTIFDGRSIRCR